MSSAQLEALDTRQIQSLSTAQIVVLSTDQVGAIETTDIAALTTAQIAALTTDQIRNGVVTDQVAALEASARILAFDVPTIELAGGSVRCMLAGIHLSRREPAGTQKLYAAASGR